MPCTTTWAWWAPWWSATGKQSSIERPKGHAPTADPSWERGSDSCPSPSRRWRTAGEAARITAERVRHERVAARTQRGDHLRQGVGVERRVVGGVGADVHEHDPSGPGGEKQARDDGRDGLTSRGPLEPAQRVDGPPEGHVALGVDDRDGARVDGTEGEAEPRARVLTGHGRDARGGRTGLSADRQTTTGWRRTSGPRGGDGQQPQPPDAAGHPSTSPRGPRFHCTPTSSRRERRCARDSSVASGNSVRYRPKPRREPSGRREHGSMSRLRTVTRRLPSDEHPRGRRLGAVGVVVEPSGAPSAVSPLGDSVTYGLPALRAGLMVDRPHGRVLRHGTAAVRPDPAGARGLRRFRRVAARDPAVCGGPVVCHVVAVLGLPACCGSRETTATSGPPRCARSGTPARRPASSVRRLPPPSP